MNEPGVAVVSEDDGFVFGEEGVEIRIAQAVRMFGAWLQGHDVDDIDDAHFELRTMVSQHFDGGECFECRNISGASHDDVGFVAVVVAGPWPDAQAGRAMFDGRIHVEPLGRGLFAGDDHVDVMTAAQTMVCDRKKGVCIRREIDTDDLGLFVHDVVDETRILMTEAVMVLTPYV